MKLQEEVFLKRYLRQDNLGVNIKYIAKILIR